jgi:hypothetical protein
MSSKPSHPIKKASSSIETESCEHLLALRLWLSENAMEMWTENEAGDQELWVACGRCARSFHLDR